MMKTVSGSGFLASTGLGVSLPADGVYVLGVEFTVSGLPAGEHLSLVSHLQGDLQKSITLGSNGSGRSASLAEVSLSVPGDPVTYSVSGTPGASVASWTADFRLYPLSGDIA
jgi:hypothetical protein